MNVEESEHTVLRWFKSSHSAGDGGDCVEVAYAWRRSSYSSGEGGQCVEVAACAHAVHVRDSKDVTRHGLAVNAPTWEAFVAFATR
jgi:hypothetical protein